ncbi:MAG: RNA-directed DNA polymerase [Granulosicoccus sp.]
MAALEGWLHECGLEMYPVKTKIVYCKDGDKRGGYTVRELVCLGFAFCARRSMNKHGKHFINFSPAMSSSAGKAIRQEVRSWGIPKRIDKSIEDLSAMFGAKIQG